jgi:hypothetical protein
MMAFGGMMLGRNDLPHVFRMTKSAKSALHVAGMTARYAFDRLSHDRGTRLTNGNGLIAALALSAEERGIELRLDSPVVELVQKDGRIAGAIVERGGKREEIAAARGVVLACGGFPANAELKARYYGHVRDGHAHRSAPPPGNRGDGIRLGQSAGGAMAEDVAYAAAWVPVSLVPQPDGSTLPFPHFYERGKPGYIAVDPAGRRFTNESASYHDFVPAMVEACRGTSETMSWLLCDHRAIRRYGMGAIGPAPLPLSPHLRTGYLLSAPTWAGLAAKIGVGAATLQATIDRFNGNAARGEDPDFGKGTDAYHRFNGDPGPLCGRKRHDQCHGRYLPRGRYHHWPGPHLRLYRGPTRGFRRPLKKAPSQRKPLECPRLRPLSWLEAPASACGRCRARACPSSSCRCWASNRPSSRPWRGSRTAACSAGR